MIATRPIEPKPSNAALHTTLEQTVSETLASQRNSRQEAEQGRRRRLRLALYRLAALISQECCSGLEGNVDNLNDVTTAAALEDNSTSSKAAIVEAAIERILCLQDVVHRFREKRPESTES